MKSAVVVGAGIAGLLAAYLLKKKADKVYLIEKAPGCGGLMTSTTNENGLPFDFGTHFLRDTGLKDLDEILYGDCKAENYHITKILKAGNYFGDFLNDKSLFIDINHLPSEIKNKAHEELMAAPKFDEAKNLDDYYRKSYGNLITDKIFNPIIKKLFGCDSKLLSATAKDLFGTSRIIAFNPEKSRELKKDSFFDSKLAFHSYYEGQSGKNNYYPKKNGMKYWIDALVKKNEEAGVTLLTGLSIEKILHKNGRVEKIILENKKQIDCDYMVWTTPLFQCLKAADLNFKMQPPQLLNTYLYHYVFDAPFTTDLFYFVCYETKYNAYRTTLYSNVRSIDNEKPDFKFEAKPPYYCTVEVVSADDIDSELLQNQLPDELKKMDVLSQKAKVLNQKIIPLKKCIPVMTTDYHQSIQDQIQFAQSQFKNVNFLGKAGGKTFFIHDVLAEVFNSINNL